MKKLMSLVVGCVLATTSWAQYDAEALDLLNAISEKYRNMAFTADFEFGLENKSAGVSDAFEGSISVEGNKYRATTPDGILINDGTDVYTFLVDAEEVNIATYYPEDEEIGFHNIFSVYKEGYKYSLMEIQNNGNKVLELAPEKEQTFFKIRMVITANTQIDRFMIFNKDGGIFTYAVKNLKEDVSLPDDTFKLLVSADEVLYNGEKVKVEVVDFR